MKRAAAVALCLSLLTLGLRTPATADNSTPSLAGAYYRYTPGATAAPPVPGLRVFIHPKSAAGTASWIGPIVTDAYGRFVFKGINSGDYVMSAYLDKTLVWQQDVVVSSAVNLAPIVLKLPSSP